MDIAAILELITSTTRAAKGAVDLAKALRATGTQPLAVTDDQIAAAIAAGEAPANRVIDRADDEINRVTGGGQ